jgi:hypothetical protein
MVTRGGRPRCRSNCGEAGASSAVARLAFPRRLARVTDPLSGFFAVRVAALDAASLRPQGFKILLEILALQVQINDLLLEVGDLLLERVDVGWGAQPRLAPGLLAEGVGEALFQVLDSRV